MNRRTTFLGTLIALTTGSALALAGAGPTAQAATYTPGITTFVSIGDGTANSTGTDPYPLSLTAHGMGGAITDVDVEIPDLYHARPSDLSLLLVAPSGTGVYLKAGSWCEHDVNYQRPHVSWRFSDQAANGMGGATCPSGWWRPSVPDWVAQEWSLPAPAPQAPYAHTLSALNGQNPNGTWRLFANDPITGAQGELGQGFRVIVSTAPTAAIIGDANGFGPASSYPIARQISGYDGKIAGLSVVLNGLSHSHPDDLDIVLEGPTGRSVVLMSDACGSADLISTPLTFSDTGATLLPEEGPCPVGIYKPSDHQAGESLPAPAPPGPYSHSLSTFVGTRMNGTWRLYINDDLYGGGGYTNSFSLYPQIAPETTITDGPRAVATSRRPRFEFSSQIPGSTFECRLDSTPWQSCTSPKTYPTVALGAHTFRVRATSPAGFRDRSPAKWEWRIRSATRDQ